MQNNEDMQKVKTLLEQKRDILKDIYIFSKGKIFKAEEEYVDAFNLYYEKRQESFDTLARIDKLLEGGNYKQISGDKCFVDIKAEIKLLSGNILVIDKRNKKIMAELNTVLAQNLKLVKEGQKMNVKYNDAVTYEELSRFDSKL